MFLKNLQNYYSLEHCDLPTMLKNVGVLLRIIAINIHEDDKPVATVSYCFIALYLIVYAYMYVFSVIWFISVRTPQTGDWVSAMIVLSVSISSGPSMVKTIFMFVFQKRIQKYTAQCLELDALIGPRNRIYARLRQNLGKLKKRVLSIWIFMVVNGYMFVLRPAFRSGRHFTEDALVVYGLEPMFESPNFEIATVLESACICISIYTFVNVIALICLTVGYVESHLLALGDDILRVWDDTLEHLNKNKNKSQIELVKMKTDFIAERLKNIIQYHILDIKLVNTIDNALKQCKVLEYIIIMGAHLTELLGGIENTYRHMPYSWAMIIIDCFTGQRLIDACHSLESAIYNCKWENFDKRNMLTVLILLQNSQKTLKLSAGGIVVLNYCCILSFYKLCYSMYTTLSIVMK